MKNMRFMCLLYSKELTKYKITRIGYSSWGYLNFIKNAAREKIKKKHIKILNIHSHAFAMNLKVHWLVLIIKNYSKFNLFGFNF